MIGNEIDKQDSFREQSIPILSQLRGRKSRPHIKVLSPHFFTYRSGVVDVCFDIGSAVARTGRAIGGPIDESRNRHRHVLDCQMARFPRTISVLLNRCLPELKRELSHGDKVSATQPSKQANAITQGSTSLRCFSMKGYAAGLVRFAEYGRIHHRSFSIRTCRRILNRTLLTDER